MENTKKSQTEVEYFIQLCYRKQTSQDKMNQTERDRRTRRRSREIETVPKTCSGLENSFDRRLDHSRPQSPSCPLAGGAWAHDTRALETRNSNFFIG